MNKNELIRKINEAKQERAKLISDMRGVLNAAEKENRDLNSDERQKYDNMEKDLDVKARKIEDMERELRLNSIEDSFTAPSAGGVQIPAGEGLTRNNVFETQEYREAFFKTLRKTDLSAEEKRALSVAGTGVEGGYLVPTEFERQIIQALESENIMRGLATVINTSSDRKIPVSAGHGTANWLDEKANFTESDETFGQKSLTAYKAGTLIKVSNELLSDSAFNLEAYLKTEFARRIGVLEEAGFINGDGSKKPSGLFKDAQVGVTTAAPTAVTSDELLDLYHSLKRAYRAKANWILGDDMAKLIRKLKDANGVYIWQPGLQAGQPDNLLGRPVKIAEQVPGIEAAAKTVAFGDISYYWIGNRQGIEFQRLNELYATSGMTGFLAHERVDGILTLPEAVKVLQMHA
jgi:HK97 family phage major capsid protein